MALYPIKLLDAAGKAVKINKGQLVQVFAVLTETPPGETKAVTRLRYVSDSTVAQIMQADDTITSEVATGPAGIITVADAYAGKTMRFRAPAKGGAYTVDVAKLPSMATGTVLTGKDCIKLKLASITAKARDEFFYQLVAREYPHLAGLTTTTALEPGLWAEASILIALLQVSEDLKMRNVITDSKSVTKAKEATQAAADAGALGDIEKAYKWAVNAAPVKFWNYFIDPGLFLYVCQPKGTASGKWPVIERYFGKSKATRATFAKVLDSYSEGMKAYVLEVAKQVYKDLFTGPRSLTGDDADFATLPDATMVIIGDGSGTAGVLGLSCEGTGIMFYDADPSKVLIKGRKQPARFGDTGPQAGGWTRPVELDESGWKKFADDKSNRLLDASETPVDLPHVGVAKVEFSAVGKGRRTALHFGASGFDSGSGRYDVCVRCGPAVGSSPKWELWFASQKSTTAAATVWFCKVIERLAGNKTKEYDPVRVGKMHTAAGFVFDTIRREISFPIGVLKDAKEFTVEVSSLSGEEIFYALCISPSAVQVNLQDIYAWSDFIPKAESDMTPEMKAQIRDVKEVMSLYDSWKVKMTGGGVGKFRDPKRMEQVVAGGKEIPGYDWSGTKKDEADKLRCSYVDFHEDGATVELRIFSFTDPTGIGKDGPSKGYKTNKDLSTLRCWAILGLVCKEFAKDGRHADAVKLFDAAGPATDPFRVTYLKRVADGAFDYDASKKAG